MNRPNLCIAVAILSFAGVPAFAVDAPVAPAVVPVVPPKLAPKQSEMAKLMLGAVQEFQAAAGDSTLNPIARLDQLSTYRFSPDTSPSIVKLFGTDRPYSVARMPAMTGKVAFQARLQPVAYTDAGGIRIEWAAVDATVNLDAAGRTMVVQGSWPSVLFEDKNVRMSARDITFGANKKRGLADLWFGNAQISIPHARMEARTAGPDIAFDDTRIDTEFVQRGKLADVHYKVSTGSISVANEQVGSFSMATRMVNLDAKMLADANAKLEKDGKTLTIEQRQKLAVPIIKQFLSQAAASGSALIIDDLRATYHGNTASLKGRISVEGRGEVDLNASLVKRILARFSVRVPVAMIKDVSGTITRKQMIAAAPGKPANEQAIAQMGQTVADTVIGQMITKGFARLENGYLESDLEFRNGILRINGKEVALPKPAPAPAVAPAAPPPAGPLIH